MATGEERREELKEVYAEARGCTRCPELARTRTQVVFGSGNADADLMFVGEAPGAKEDERGIPFVGAAGELLDELLEGVGMQRSDVFIANVLKCLRYNAMVQLGDGSWERIGRLVRSRYDGTVMSVGPDGELVPRRVTGWHATPLGGRKVFQLSFRSAKIAGARKVNVQLTGDHPVLTEDRGYVAAERLTSRDRVATGQGLSEMAFDVVCGTLLGDASIARSRAIWTCTHCAKQRPYALWLADLLGELRTTSIEVRVAKLAVNGERLPDATQVRTRAHRALHLLRAEFYGDRKVVPAWLAQELNPRMLAFWFMDDGYMRIRPGGRRPLAELAANGFAETDRQVLLQGLLRLGLPAKSARGRIFFNVDASRELSRMIAPFVHPSMRYKLHPDDVPRASPFPPVLERGATRVMYDEVEIQDITDWPRNDTTFFCINVEDTQNFVTSGGVVHNCRPPGNRDPQPVEIENCQGYLMRQVELIQPRVICTLGNFATKLLRGDNTGITRLHGQAEIRVIGSRAVRLYPLYHPAAALYTRSLLETLQADMARLPALLALDPPEQPEPAAPDLDPVPEPAVPEPALDPVPEPVPDPGDAEPPPPAVPDDEQLGLF